MDEIPNEIQWLVFCSRVRTLAQVRYCIYDVYMSGGFLFIEAKSCDDEAAKHVYTLDREGNLL